MSDERSDFDAMVLPRGAQIAAGESRHIELNVQGDIILQENQRELVALNSHHGSILIDKDVTIRSRSIAAKKMIRVRGRLESDEIRAGTIFLEGGALLCGSLNTDRLTSQEGSLEARSIKSNEVQIAGGHVEIGAIFADSLLVEGAVQGAIMITSAKEMRVAETAQVKGGFESDVELLGFLLKFRHQFMSDRVLAELKTRKEGRELKRFLLREAADADIHLIDDKESRENGELETQARETTEHSTDDDKEDDSGDDSIYI